MIGLLHHRGLLALAVFVFTFFATTQYDSTRKFSAAQEAARGVALTVWRQNMISCVRVTRPNRAKSDLRATLDADGWRDGWLSKRNLVKLNRAQGQEKVADENADLAAKLHDIEVKLREPLLNPPCSVQFPAPEGISAKQRAAVFRAAQPR